MSSSYVRERCLHVHIDLSISLHTSFLTGEYGVMTDSGLVKIAQKAKMNWSQHAAASRGDHRSYEHLVMHDDMRKEVGTDNERV